MVTFKLIERTDKKLIYHYFPEGHENKCPGVIVVDISKDEINIKELAEEDWEYDIPPEEINELAERINHIKHEKGETDFAELVTEPIHSIYYGDHAIREILKQLCNGKVPENGMQAWY
ncbi:MAG: hypothetical protein J1F60_03970 [Oscillospiraceae bacterium]|nr:hypothetical protein [Oscillospiraceae bacterium]